VCRSSKVRFADHSLRIGGELADPSGNQRYCCESVDACSDRATLVVKSSKSRLAAFPGRKCLGAPRMRLVLNALRTVLASAASWAFLVLVAYGSAKAQARKIELGDLQKIVDVSSPEISPDGKSIVIIVLVASLDFGAVGPQK
jgi:hypothetical protein